MCQADVPKQRDRSCFWKGALEGQKCPDIQKHCGFSRAKGLDGGQERTDLHLHSEAALNMIEI